MPCGAAVRRGGDLSISELDQTVRCACGFCFFSYHTVRGANRVKSYGALQFGKNRENRTAQYLHRTKLLGYKDCKAFLTVCSWEKVERYGSVRIKTLRILRRGAMRYDLVQGKIEGCGSPIMGNKPTRSSPHRNEKSKPSK